MQPAPASRWATDAATVVAAIAACAGAARPAALRWARALRVRAFIGPLALALAGFAAPQAQAATTDCIEQGGQAVCSVAQPAPWSYGLCDEAGTYVYRYIAWCHARGGTWLGLDQGCINYTPDDEGNLIQHAQAFSDILHTPAVCTPSDTGWGQSVTSYLCWTGGPTYTSGILTSDMRTMSFSCGETIRALRSRALVCPAGTAQRNISSRTVCVHPVESSCGVGNPVLPGTGRKIQIEDDVVFDGFTLRRYYSSTGSIFQYNSSVDRISIDSVWRDSFDVRLQPISSSSAAIAAVSFPNGDLQYFRADGTAILAQQDNAARLQAFADRYVLNSGTASHVFDLTGRLVALVTTEGQRFTLRYADGTLAGPNGRAAVDGNGAALPVAVPAGHLIEVRSVFGRVLRYDRDAGGRLMQILSPASTTPIRYAYGDAASGGHLSKVVYPDHASREYIYNEPAWTAGASLKDALTGIVVGGDSTPAVRFASFGYRADGLAVSTEHAGGVERYALSFSTGQTTVQDPIGSTRTLTFGNATGVLKQTGTSQPGGSGCLASNSANVYDTATGNLTSADDFNHNRTCYAYDASHRETTRVEGLPTSTACSAVTAPAASLPAGSRRTSSVWHPDWRLPARVAEPGRLTTSVFNGQLDPLTGAIATCAPASALLPDGKPIAVLCKRVEQATTDADGHLGLAAAPDTTVAARVQTWTYNERGQVLTAKGPRTDVDDTTTFIYYESAGADHGLGDLQTRRNAVGIETAFVRYDAAGQLLQMQDPNGVAVVNTYDERRRLKSTSVGGQTTGYAYWPTGLLKQVNEADGSFIHYDYDDAQRLYLVTDNRGVSVKYTLDNLGNRTVETFKDASGTVTRLLNRSIDALGRVQQTTGRL